MVTPDRRRVAVKRLQERFGVSERRACRFARRHPRSGWRKAHTVARREGLAVNPKRTRRIWSDEGLQRPPRRRAKRRRLDDSTAAKLRACRPNHVWALDFQFDETADCRRLKLLNIVDEIHTRGPGRAPARSIDADGVVGVLDRIAAERGAPEHLRMDNGPELVAWALRDWCRITGARTAYIEPGSPWENPFAESFNGRLRDECLNIEEFANPLEARVVLKDWQTQYNTYRPHQSLGGLTPPPTPPTGRHNNNPHSHNNRTHKRVPLNTFQTVRLENART